MKRYVTIRIGQKKRCVQYFRLLCLIFGLLLSCLTFFPRQSQAASGQTVTIQITGSTHVPGFSPPLTTVHVNDTIVFVNQAFPAASYSISADDGSFSSPSLSPGMRWETQFGSSGTHTFRDRSLPQQMVGEILVVDASVALLPTPVPAVEATILTIIKAGQKPPDTVTIPQLPVKHSVQKPALVSSHAAFNLFIIVIIIICIGILLLGGSIIFQVQKQKVYEQGQKGEDEDEDEDDGHNFAQYLALNKRTIQRLTLELPKKGASTIRALRQRMSREDEDEDEDDMEDTSYE